MNTFLTSDHHWGHRRILEYCKRPFASIEEHDEELIRRWNSVVTNDDLVYHLGDLLFGTWKQVPVLLNRLRYKRLVFVSGNHDRPLKEWAHKALKIEGGLDWRGRQVEVHDSYLETKIDGRDVTLCHYAMRAWNRGHRGSPHFFAHWHHSVPDDPNSLSIDVGVDGHDYTPISFDTAMSILKKKPAWEKFKDKS